MLDLRGRRAWRAAMVVLALAVSAPALVAGPAGADDGAPWSGREARSSRIIGGTVAPDGAWPSQAALVTSSANPEPGIQFCGATVIDPMWVMTANHCVRYSDTGGVVPARLVDVRVGTQDLSRGGTTIRAAEIRARAGFTFDNLRNDIALIRLSRATSVPVQAIAPPGDVLAAGTPLTAIGWGQTSGSSTWQPKALRQAELAAQDDDACQAGLAPYFQKTTMICAWAPARAACYGDSGGPLLVRRDDTWVQVGVASWTIDDCSTDWPTVFERVSAHANWVRQVRDVWPHPDAAAFVRRAHLDLFDRAPTAAELQHGVSQLGAGSGAAYLAALVQAPLAQARVAGVGRLYRAFFLRQPDTAGLAYWWDGVNHGRSLPRIANLFASSDEFVRRYGELDDGEFVDLVYRNVLGREADPEGRAHWVGELSSGARTRGTVMVGFSESQENKALQAPRTNVVVTYFALVRRVPTATELAAALEVPLAQTARALLTSRAYIDRVT